MKDMKHSARLAVALGLSLTLVAAPLAACGNTGAGTDGAAPEEKETAALDNAVEEQDAPEAADGNDAATDAAAGEVSGNAFTVTIPEYWQGRVETSTTEQNGLQTTSVYLAGNPEAELASFEMVDGAEPVVAGDIGRHLITSFSDGNGHHVEVWTSNWPWIAVMSAEGGDMGVDIDEATYRELVDLSTGGALTYDKACEDGADAVSMEESNYSSQALASAVSFG